MELLLTQPTQDILTQIHAMRSGLCFASLSLNRSKQLNALSLTMLRTIQHHLNAWKKDPTIAFVVIQSTQERFFCAGGDVRAIRDHAMRGHSKQVAEFFDLEYSVDELIHRYPKPVVVFGQGFIMGGGAGLFVGASHRIMYEHSSISMPEVSIGLFPDVGGSWFFNRMPAWLGRFIALTATPLTPGDALYTGLSDYVLGHDAHPPSHWLQEWSLSPAVHQVGDRRSWDTYLSESLERNVLPPCPSHLQTIWHWLQAIGRQPSLESFSKKLHMLHHHSPILEAACLRLREASPRALQETWNMLKKQRFSSLTDCFNEERRLAVHLCVEGDFCEGVRAKLIDKQPPPWQNI
jgi:enoyl-CoA hydratase/carnithine racemase